MGNVFLEQLNKATEFLKREYVDVFNDQEELWGIDKLDAIKFPFYLRTINRRVKFSSNEEPIFHYGLGVRDETFKRLLVISSIHPEEFYKNIWLLPILGSWKDLWELMFYDMDLELNSIDRTIIYELIKEGLMHDIHRDRIIKFMPRIKSKSKLTTAWLKASNDFAKEFASFMGWTIKEYNSVKTNGLHKYQTYLNEGLYSNIDWETIGYREMVRILSSNVSKNELFRKYFLEWFNNYHFSSYFDNFNIFKCEKLIYNTETEKSDLAKIYIEKMVNEKFNNTVSILKNDGGDVLCSILEDKLTTRFIEGSFFCKRKNDALFNSISIACACISKLNKGIFKNRYVRGSIMDKPRIKEVQDELSCFVHRPYQDVYQFTISPYPSKNSFVNIAELLSEFRNKNKEIPLEEYPTKFLVMDTHYDYNEKYEDSKIAYKRLKKSFPKKYLKNIKFIYWCLSHGFERKHHISYDNGRYEHYNGCGYTFDEVINGKIDRSSLNFLNQPLLSKIII